MGAPSGAGGATSTRAPAQHTPPAPRAEGLHDCCTQARGHTACRATLTGTSPRPPGVGGVDDDAARGQRRGTGHRPGPARPGPAAGARRRDGRGRAPGAPAGAGLAVVVAGARRLGLDPTRANARDPLPVGRGRAAAAGLAAGPGRRRDPGACSPRSPTRRGSSWSCTDADGTMLWREGVGRRCSAEPTPGVHRGRALDRGPRRHQRHRHRPGRTGSGAAVLGRALRGGPAPLVLHRHPPCTTRAPASCSASSTSAGRP